MPHVRTQAVGDEYVSLRFGLNALTKTAKAMGRKQNATAPTTNTVVLSALLSLVNLSVSSCGNCWVLIIILWRRVSRYNKI